jgi:hypothetical protein
MAYANSSSTSWHNRLFSSDLEGAAMSALITFAKKMLAGVPLWIFLVTFVILALHPIPECVACEYRNPWGRSDTMYYRDSIILDAWLVLASFGAGVLRVRRGWLVPVLIVAAHLLTQPIGGVTITSLWLNEGPMILVLGLGVGAASLALGYLVRNGVEFLRVRFRSSSHETLG